MVEEVALTVDNGLRYPQYGLKALLDVANEPLRFLQLRRELLVR